MQTAEKQKQWPSKAIFLGLTKQQWRTKKGQTTRPACVGPQASILVYRLYLIRSRRSREDHCLQESRSGEWLNQGRYHWQAWEGPGRWTRCKRPVYHVRSRREDARKETDLSNVQVGAVLVQLRVVEIEDSFVDARGIGNAVASVTELDDTSSGAILALPTETEGGARHQIVALGVNDVVIDDRELVAGGE